MIPETNDPRRVAKRWAIILFVVIVAAMAATRTLSVKHRSHSRGLLAQRTEHAGNAAGRAGVGEQSPNTERTEPLSAFDYAVCADNEIQIDGSDGGGTIVVGNLHNNARHGGRVRIAGVCDVFGRVTSVGTITVGFSDKGVPAVIHGSVKADTIEIGALGEVRSFEDLNEEIQGVDLDRDGDAGDFLVGKVPAAVEAFRRITSSGAGMLSGDTDRHIADGTQAVELGVAPPPPIAPPHPDFRVYYAMVTGLSTYPPENDHALMEIAGDGQGHYFSSAPVFLEWINSQKQVNVLCWRCAGDGQIGPENSTDCPTCEGTGKTPAVEITGVFYIDDETLDLSRIETSLVIHGTIVVAKGDPFREPRGTVQAGGRSGGTDQFQRKGSLIVGGPTRMHLRQTYRSDREGGPYIWRHRSLRTGDDQQTIPLAVPEEEHEMRAFPAFVAASQISIAPRGAGFASYAGDIGDEASTVLEGILFAGSEIRIGGRGGWKGEAIVFDEEEARAEDDILDESILRIDLNDDGDVFDLVKISDVSGRPVVPVSRGHYSIDINNDGVLRKTVIGEDYGEFFSQNGYTPPVLVYHEGSMFAETISIGGQCAVLFDPNVPASKPLFGFGVSPGN